MIEIPISRRHYLVGSVLPLLALVLLIPACAYSPGTGVGKILFFGSFSAFLVLFAGLHLPYLIMPNRFSLTVGPDGIYERTSINSVLIEWGEIEKISLRAIDSNKLYVTYRLHNKTIGRWFSFGGFDCMHRNEYAISQRDLLQILSEELGRYHEKR